MKVVINKCFGGFGLSDEAIEACIALGMTVADANTDADADFLRENNPDDKDFYGQYYCPHDHERKFRCDPRLVQTVERLGKRANGMYASLKVVDIPFETAEGWYIDEYDGVENINQCHESWG